MKKIIYLCLLLLVSNNIRSQAVGTGDWSSVRLYGHAYNVDGFSETEYNWIADHNIIFTTEKRHANVIYGNPSTELASGVVATQIVANNTQVKPLFYWNSSKVFSAIYETIQTAVTQNPTWTFESQGYEKWNYDESTFRDWWVDIVKDQVNNTAHRGVFIDAVPNVAGTLGDAALQYLHGMMDELPGLVIYNGFYTQSNGNQLAGLETLEHADGVFVETFLRAGCDTPDKGKKLLDALLNVPSDKYIIANYEPTTSWNSTDHKFGLAAYLIIANNRSFFRYYEGSYDTSFLTYWHSDFAQEIGSPTSSTTVNGYVYTRTFENASVTLDLQNKTSSIVWGTTTPNVNLALAGVAKQSTTGHNGAAARAIDGDTNGAWSGGSVTHTAGGEANAYWQVNLGSDNTIGQINIFNRTDSCCKSRLSNFTVLLVDSNGNINYKQTITSIPYPSISIDAGGAQGKIIRVRSNNDSIALSLAEVEVYATTSLAKSLVLEKKINIDNVPIIYPNPASSDIKINLNGFKNANIDIINSSGQIVISKATKGLTDIITIDISKLATGVYTLRMDNKTTIKHHQFIKN